MVDLEIIIMYFRKDKHRREVKLRAAVGKVSGEFATVTEAQSAAPVYAL